MRLVPSSSARASASSSSTRSSWYPETFVEETFPEKKSGNSTPSITGASVAQSMRTRSKSRAATRSRSVSMSTSSGSQITPTFARFSTTASMTSRCPPSALYSRRTVRPRASSSSTG